MHNNNGVAFMCVLIYIIVKYNFVKGHLNRREGTVLY